MIPGFNRFPSRRFELTFGVALILGCLGLIGLAHKTQELAWLLSLVTLELLIPLVMSLISAGLLAGDPAIEILLTVHRPAWWTLAERIGLVLGVAAGLGGLLLYLAERWGIMLPKDVNDRMFIWLSPLIFYLGLANAVALLRGRVLDGAIAILGVTGFSLLALLQIPRLCAGLPKGTQCLWWLSNPFMTLGDATHPTWPLNRIIWLGVGIGLLALSFAWARREEPLLPQSPSE